MIRQIIGRSATAVLGLLVVLFLVLVMAGSVEARTFYAFNLQDLPDDNPGDGICATTIVVGEEQTREVCTLRGAVMETNAYPGADKIRLRRGTYVLDYKLCRTDEGITETMGSCGDLDIRDKVTITGAGQDLTVIAAMVEPTVFNQGWNLEERVFDVQDGSVVTIEKLTVFGGEALGDPQDGQDFPVQYDELYCPIIEPSDRGDGGGLLNRGGIVFLKEVVFDNNLAICDGGAVDTINDGITSIRNALLTNNVAIVDGGALMADDDSITGIFDSQLELNNAFEDGGAIAGNDALVGVFTTSIQYNTAMGYGGGIWNSRSDVMLIKDSIISFNDVPGGYESDGGGVFNDDGFILLRGTVDIRWNSPNDYVDWNEPQGPP